MADYYGCGDSLCFFGRGPGVMTNGGCRCLEDIPHEKRRRVMFGILHLRQQLENLRAKEKSQ